MSGDETSPTSDTTDTSLTDPCTGGCCSVGSEGCACTQSGVCNPGLICNEALICEFGVGDPFVPCSNCNDVEFCVNNTCYPDNGQCGVCPEFRLLEGAVGFTNSCIDGYCRISVPALNVPLPDSDPGPGTIVVKSPGADSALEGSSQFEFNYISPREVSAVIVLDDLPTVSDLQRSAVWGAFAKATSGKETVVRWEDGHPIQNGNWTDLSPQSLDTGRYYAFAFAIQGGLMTEVSALIPFSVGDDVWPSVNSACKDTYDCQSFAFALDCHPQQKLCKILCGSNFDCDVSEVCVAVDSGEHSVVRLCL
jgi:hypothetical protein